MRLMDEEKKWTMTGDGIKDQEAVLFFILSFAHVSATYTSKALFRLFPLIFFSSPRGGD